VLGHQPQGVKPTTARPIPTQVRHNRRLLNFLALAIVAPLAWWLIASATSTGMSDRLATEPGGAAPDFTLTLFHGNQLHSLTIPGE